MSNIKKHAAYMNQFVSQFRCPICDSSMKVTSWKSLICLTSGHTFDISRHGYVNFLTKPVKSSYRAGLFEARSQLMAEYHFFAPLHQAIADLISDRKSEKETLTILDCGCGEGTHLKAVCDLLQKKKTVHGIGIDIAKDGILRASKNSGGMLWAVADVANAPFQDRQFDVILSIFSPSNYAEFHRLLKKDGLVIKVVPQKDYLTELRQVLYADSERRTYSNTPAIERFTTHFQLDHLMRLRYTKTLHQQGIEWLLNMTPLAWSASAENINQFRKMESAQLTVDVDVLIGTI